VGLTLAMDLQSRGVQVAIAEIRRYAEPPNVKCNHVAARTMERFRRLGVAQKLRDAGLPRGLPERRGVPHQRVRHELTRIPIPAGRALHLERRAGHTWWPRPSRRTASTSCSSNPSCWNTRRRCPA
jgi:2-polyprenyl-6-methoxyphenol hydroxylase-like FAD-dependent oxidoreductase